MIWSCFQGKLSKIPPKNPLDAVRTRWYRAPELFLGTRGDQSVGTSQGAGKNRLDSRDENEND